MRCGAGGGYITPLPFVNAMYDDLKHATDSSGDTDVRHLSHVAQPSGLALQCRARTAPGRALVAVGADVPISPSSIWYLGRGPGHMTRDAPDAVMSDQSAQRDPRFHTAHPLTKAPTLVHHALALTCLNRGIRHRGCQQILTACR